MDTKNILLIMLVLFTVVSDSYGQKKKDQCKYLKNEVDEFTKKIEVRTVSEELFYEKKLASKDRSDMWCKTSLDVIACNFNGINNLFFWLTSCSCDDNSFYIISLLLNNDEVINFSKHSELEYNENCKNYWQFFVVSDSTWSVLGSTPVKKIRIIYNNSQRTFEIKENNQDMIMKVINCIDELKIPKSIDK